MCANLCSATIVAWPDHVDYNTPHPGRMQDRGVSDVASPRGLQTEFTSVSAFWSLNCFHNCSMQGMASGWTVDSEPRMCRI